MINSVTLVGRVTKDLELKYSQGGVAVCKFNLAVNRNFKSKDGEQGADYPMILTFNKTAENAANYLRKGSLVGVTGRIQTGSYEDKDGRRVFTTEILADSVQFLEPKSSNTNNAPSNQYNGYQQQGNTNTPNQQQNAQNRQETTHNQAHGQVNDPFSVQGGPITVSDDDLPF